jgi:hypothetical protein
MKKDAFDNIYKRFMIQKLKTDCYRDEQRRQKEIAEENELKEYEKSRKMIGSITRVNKYIHKVEKDLRSRMCKAETLRQKKCIEEENKLKSMFKPKTNISKGELVQIRKSLEHKTKDTRQKKANFISFENNKGFNNNDYELSKSKEFNNLLDLEANFASLQRKKELLERATNDVKNPEQTRSIKLSGDGNILMKSTSHKKFNEMIGSEN